MGNLAYVSGESLFVLDVSDPRSPRRLAAYEYWGVFTVGDRLLLRFAGNGGLSIFELIREARFATVKTVNGDQLFLQVTGTPGVDWEVQRSVDLEGWADWKSIMLNDTPLVITDDLGPHQRFYRIVVPQ